MVKEILCQAKEHCREKASWTAGMFLCDTWERRKLGILYYVVPAGYFRVPLGLICSHPHVIPRSCIRKLPLHRYWRPGLKSGAFFALPVGIYPPAPSHPSQQGIWGRWLREKKCLVRNAVCCRCTVSGNPTLILGAAGRVAHGVSLVTESAQTNI